MSFSSLTFRLSRRGTDTTLEKWCWFADTNIKSKLHRYYVSFKGTSFFSTFVYGAPKIQNRQGIWNLLSNISLNRNSAWYLTGGFNEITDNFEKKSRGRERPESSFGAFRTFLSSCDLFDIKHTGNFLSWRGRKNTHLVHCRLDRAMVNSLWSDLFPNGKSHYFQFESFDHMPLPPPLTQKRRNLHAYLDMTEGCERILISSNWWTWPWLQDPISP